VSPSGGVLSEFELSKCPPGKDISPPSVQGHVHVVGTFGIEQPRLSIDTASLLGRYVGLSFLFLASSAAAFAASANRASCVRVNRGKMPSAF
jgi:hypothetical protein